MPVTKVKTKWASGNLVFTDESGNAIMTFNADDKTIEANFTQEIEHHTAADTLTVAETGSLHTNLGATGAVTLTLPQDAEADCFFEFGVMAAQELRITPGAAGAIYVNGAKQTDNKYISADDEGESLKLVADGNGDWIALYTTGTWTVET